MKDYKLKLRKLRSSHCRLCSPFFFLKKKDLGKRVIRLGFGLVTRMHRSRLYQAKITCYRNCGFRTMQCDALEHKRRREMMCHNTVKIL